MHNFEDTSRLSLRISSTVVAVPVTRLFLNEILKDKDYEEDYVIEGFSFKLLRANLPCKVKGTASSNGAFCLIKALKSLKHSAFSWNEALAKDLPSCWEIHGDLLMLPEGCFVMKDWEALGRCNFYAKHFILCKTFSLYFDFFLEMYGCCKFLHSENGYVELDNYLFRL